MSVPRTLTLRKKSKGYVLVQKPVRELETLRRRKAFELPEFKLNGSRNISVTGKNYEFNTFELLVDANVKDCDEFAVWVCGANSKAADTDAEKMEKTIIRYHAKSKTLSVDRRNSGRVDFHPKFPGVHSAPLELQDGKLKLRILVDTSSVEVFGQDGEVVVTDRIFPSPANRSTGVMTKGGEAEVESLKVYSLRSIWR